MKVTLKTGVTYPRHSGQRHEAGTSLDVPDAVAADWAARGIAVDAKEWDGSPSGESKKPPPHVPPPVHVPKGKK